jgi:hypothetical protein
VTGVITLPISFGGIIIEQQFHVFKTLHNPLILGVDFLKPNGAVIDFETKTVTIQQGIATVYMVQTNVGIVRSQKPVEIAPHTQVTIPVKVSKQVKDSVALLEPLPALHKYGIAGAKCVVQVRKGKSLFTVLNPTSEPVYLPANKVLATAAHIDVNTVQVLSDDLKPKVSNSCSNQVNDDISFDIDGAHLTESQRQRLHDFLVSNRQTFAPSMKELGKTDLYQHRVETGDHSPFL